MFWKNHAVYDPETVEWVPVVYKRRQIAVWGLTFVGAVLVSAFLVAGLWDRAAKSPEELALLAENEVLRSQLERTDQVFEEFTERIRTFSRQDQILYRVLLGAPDIPDDVRQAGVGGTDVYDDFDRFGASTRELLRQSSRQLDRIERQMGIQTASYRELMFLAESQQKALEQRPAIMPTDGHITSGYGIRTDPIHGRLRHHPGVDIPARTGTPVFATAAGVIEKIERRNSGYGFHVVIAHPAAGFKTLYAHLSAFDPEIFRGKVVKRGDRIGFSGNTGRSIAPHLHYEVHRLSGGTLDPLPFIAPSMTPQRFLELLADDDASRKSLD